MALTSNSDLYVAIHDLGIDRVVRHLMRQRPSLFNYGTALVASNPEMLCELPEVAPEVLAANNPITKTVDPVPVLGTSFGLNFCAQLRKGEIDFHPGNIITLPSELNPPLGDQLLSMHFRVCAGIGCPSERVIFPGHFPYPLPPSRVKHLSRATSNRYPGEIVSPVPPVLSPETDNTGTVVLPTSKIECFCLDLFATAGCKIAGFPGNQRIEPSVKDIDIPELKPEGLKESLECYALTALNRGILPTVGQTISNIAFGLITLPDTLGDLQISASTTVPHNPAIEDDQLKAFINLDRIDLNINVGPSSGGGGGGGGGGTVTRTTRGRTRTGTFDLTAAISGKAFLKIYDAVIKGFRFSKSGTGSWGPFSISYSVAARLEGGTISLTNNGAIKVSELDIKWDTLHLDIGVNIPEQCVGISWPVDLEYCFFSDNPDFSMPLDLSDLITSELTLTVIPRVFYGVGSGVPNRWQIAMEPTLPIDIDIIDIADTVEDLFHNLIVSAIDNLLSLAPDWARDLIDSLLGGVEDIIRTVLDIPDDIGEWILDMIGNLGIFQDLVDALAQYISITVFELEDPYPALPADGSLIPVKLPIQYLGINVNSDEMVLTGDIGD